MCRRIAHFLPTGWLRRSVFCFALIACIAGCERTPTIEEIRALHASGRFDQSIDLLRRRIEEMPDDPETNYLYGAALSRSGAPRLAIWSLRKAAESSQWEVAANLELADAQSRAENWQAAIEATNAVLDLEPANPEAHIIRGIAYLTEGKQVDRALEDFDFLLDLDPKNFAALTSRASALILLGRVDEASRQIDEIEAMANENPSDAGSQAQLCATQAVLLRERGDLTLAEERFDRCLEKFPAFAIVVEPAMEFFDAQGDRDRSTAILSKALELAPISLDYREALAERLEKAGEPERALAVLKDGLSVEDHQIKSALLTDITNYYVERDQLNEAIAAYEDLLSMVGDVPQLALLNHADLLARAGRHEEARRVAKGLEPAFYAELIEARIALDEGDPQRALDSLDRVFPKWPNNAGARYYAARAAEQLGDFVRAIDEYRQSIRSGSDQTEAALRLAKLYLMAGSNAEAWASATQYIMNHNYDPEGARV
ncbi:tetratricopeptide repeat protein, partial [Myxococcota bacterium]|nr:tetratricopeptide repeat protein [Myxococcota bacterium]